MALLGFKKEFALMVESGIKRQTVRLLRKHPIKQGEMLHMYTGLRRPGTKLLQRSRCLYAAPVYLDFHIAVLDGKKLSAEERNDFARRDGFVDWWAFIVCIRDMHGLPFEGQVIRW